MRHSLRLLTQSSAAPALLIDNDRTPAGVRCNARFGRVETEMDDTQIHRLMTQSGCGGTLTPAVRRFAQACAALGAEAEREQCEKAMQAEWRLKVRRLVQGFEHVSGLARLWEPDHSTGSERALWTRATEACSDVVKLLNSKA